MTGDPGSGVPLYLAKCACSGTILYMRDWSIYVAKTKGKTPTAGIGEAISYTKSRKRALDIGCGAMSDIDTIAAAGFEYIDAVDIEPTIAAIAAEKVAAGVPVTFHNMPFHAFQFHPDTYDFINAQFAIPFAGPEHIEEVMEGIRHSIKRDGVFFGTFFGYEDEWANDTAIAIHSRETIEEFFNTNEWNVHKIEESIYDSETAGGKVKHWHVFTVIASRIDTM